MSSIRFLHMACLVPTERVKFMIFVLEKDEHMKGDIYFKGTCCNLKLNHHKFNFANHAETKWFSGDKIRPPQFKLF